MFSSGDLDSNRISSGHSIVGDFVVLQVKINTGVGVEKD